MRVCVYVWFVQEWNWQYKRGGTFTWFRGITDCVGAKQCA